MTGADSPPSALRAALERRDDAPRPTVASHRRIGRNARLGRVGKTGTRRHYRITDTAVVDVLDPVRAVKEGA